MKTNSRRANIFAGALVVILLVALGGPTALASEQYFVSFGLVDNIGDQELLPNNVYEYDAVNDTASLFLDGATAGLNTTMNGVDVLRSGNVLLSFGFAGVIGGQEIKTDNIYEYDPVNDVASVFLDGGAAGLNSTINGIDLLPSGNLLLSFGFNGNIGNLPLLTNSIYEFDPASGVATVFLDGGAIGLNNTINGIDLLPSGDLLMTFGFVGNIGGQTLLPNNIYQYNPVSGATTLFFDGNAVGLNSVVNGIASLKVIPEPSSLLLCLLAAAAIAAAQRTRFFRCKT